MQLEMLLETGLKDYCSVCSDYVDCDILTQSHKAFIRCYDTYRYNLVIASLIWLFTVTEIYV